jgi:preprotein translocase subunit SecE
MAEELNKVNEAVEENSVAKDKADKKAEPKAKVKKPNILKRLGKFFKDTAGELKKVAWTPKSEVWKSFKLVIATVVAISALIAVIDFASSWIINSIAGLIG